MTEHTDVVIVGAGGGGAVLGLALAQRGIRAVVLEQGLGPPSGLRGEILQPNGQRILDKLSVLGALPPHTIRSVSHFHFYRAGGDRLCTIDYGMLPPPYNRAIVTLPNAAHHAILEALDAAAPGSLRYGTVFKGVLREAGRVVGVEAEHAGRQVKVRASLVVGADGALSKVRDALAIPTQLHRYREGYLIAILGNPSGGLTDARYYVGRRSILGIFPASENKAYLFYMIPADSMAQIKAGGREVLRRAWSAIAPDLAPVFDGLTDWNQVAYMPTGRVRTSTWVVDGAVLIGDAAHAMNPHASQGRMQAMEDAMTLAELIPAWLKTGDVSAKVLSAFERARRPQVNMLQRLADEQVIFWNTGNPLLGYLRDRVFRTFDRNRRLRYQVLATTAGLRATAPFGLMDRVIAAGLWPDRHADRLPSDAAMTLHS
jgi:2-polyprenyl-6-methoxyphenol hydroxylase-like FAD-dependent oxidoreductase